MTGVGVNTWLVTIAAENGSASHWGTNFQVPIGEGMAIDNADVLVAGGNTWSFASHAYLRLFDFHSGVAGNPMPVVGATALGLNGRPVGVR